MYCFMVIILFFSEPDYTILPRAVIH
ncbi:protein of unknown function [Candidatus Promineifilum breve]|uniref:Uncharacterized protein n=1 Tax=Candidatus Promineifilum breve TaxID=1806508 RepID=A0A160T483_9CHLR|nr:protein of unknown function [Candidatus Promineifilum breve]